MSLTKHPEYQAFIAAVLAEPDDDLPRLQFSDWLDERGDPRGQFIKTQIELEKYQDERHALQLSDVDAMRNLIWDRLQEADRLMKQEREAYEQCFMTSRYPQAQIEMFTRPVHNALVAGTPVTSLLSWFRRGFIHNIRATFNEWIANAEAIIAQNPLKEATLTTYPEIVFQEWDDIARFMHVIEAHIRHTESDFTNPKSTRRNSPAVT